jgi:hypothetical protein
MFDAKEFLHLKKNILIEDCLPLDQSRKERDKELDSLAFAISLQARELSALLRLIKRSLNYQGQLV